MDRIVGIREKIVCKRTSPFEMIVNFNGENIGSSVYSAGINYILYPVMENINPYCNLIIEKYREICDT